MQAEYIAKKRIQIQKKMISICEVVAANTMNYSKQPNKYRIEMSMGTSMAGIGINVYNSDHKDIESVDCYGIHWPFEHMMFFNKERFDRDVNEKLMELETILKVAKKYYNLNNK